MRLICTHVIYILIFQINIITNLQENKNLDYVIENLEKKLKIFDQRIVI